MQMETRTLEWTLQKIGQHRFAEFILGRRERRDHFEKPQPVPGILVLEREPLASLHLRFRTF